MEIEIDCEDQSQPAPVVFLEDNVDEPIAPLPIAIIESRGQDATMYQPALYSQPNICSSISWLFDDSVYSPNFMDLKRTDSISRRMIMENASYTVDQILDAHPERAIQDQATHDLENLSYSFNKQILAQTNLIHTLVIQHIIDMDVRREFETFYTIFMFGSGFACSAYKCFLFQTPTSINQLGINSRSGALQSVALHRGM